MSTPLLEMRGVGKSYPHHNGPVLSGVSLAIFPGQAWGLMGPSGAGKSTLARLAMSLETCDQGEVLFQGLDLSAMNRRERRRLLTKVQIVWQDPSVYLNPFADVLRSVVEPMEVHGLSRGAAALDRGRELLTMVGLDQGLAHRKPGELSGGQCQRVALARALSLGPELLICDEALVSLDLVQQVRILELLHRLRVELGLTLLFISHELTLVRKLCTHLAIMEKGSLVEQRPLKAEASRGGGPSKKE